MIVKKQNDSVRESNITKKFDKIWKTLLLAASLSKLEIGENIPPELYEVVAQVLLFVDKMDRLKSAVAEKRR